MSRKLDAYLEEISHFLSGREEREEILSEIRSHIVEKAAAEHGQAADAAIEKAIASYGPARKVAEKYLDGRPIIALFAASMLTLLAKVFTRSRWVDAASNVVSLVLTGFLLGQPFDNLFAVAVPERLLPKIKFGARFILLFIAVMITIDLVKNLVVIGRRRLDKSA